MKDGDLTAFSRVFKYVWPQWPRLIAIVISAIIIGILFSLSFATIIPMLKVMMAEEGMHGWVDRKACNWRYDINFHVPSFADVMGKDDKDITNYLLVVDVDDESFAYQAGLRETDQIVGVGNLLITDEVEKQSSSELLEELATTQKDSISVQVRRMDDPDKLLEMQFSAAAPESTIARMKVGLIEKAQGAISFLPRNQPKESREKAIRFIIILMVAVTMGRCAARFYQAYLAEKVVQIAIARLREDLFDHIMHMPVGFFSNEGTSDTVSRLLGDTGATGKGIKILLGKAIREPMKAIFTLCFAFAISWQLTLIFIGCAPFTIGLFAVLGKKIRKATKKTLVSSALMLGRVQGAIGALRVVKVYNQQDREVADYSGVNRRFLRQILRVAKIQAGTGPIMEILGMFAASGALLVGAHWVFNENLDPTSFFGLLIFLGTSAESIRKVSDVWNKIQQANAAGERVFEVIDHPMEIENKGVGQLGPVKDRIEFRDVVFTYPGSETPVLRGANLTIKAGQTIAVVGPNGSGKTTLVNLLPRFYDVESGSVLIDGIDIKDVTLKSLRDQIAMVTQNVVTFNDTIAANISYGCPDASMDEIIAAAKSSYAHEFIEVLPDGYDTFIGENSAGFSGGQLQRIVIARAMLKNPAILIFDEAMSQVDADSEAKIHDALSELVKDRTCFVIAHRFSTVISADVIAVVDKGRIEAKGTHAELIESCALYRSLYETQLMAPQE